MGEQFTKRHDFKSVFPAKNNQMVTSPYHVYKLCQLDYITDPCRFVYENTQPSITKLPILAFAFDLNLVCGPKTI